MKGLKKIFEGNNYVVYRSNGTEFVSNAIKKGFFIESNGVLYDKKGRRVIITQSDFFHYPRLVGNCGGSVFGVNGHYVFTNWHVASCTDTLDMGNSNYYMVSWIKEYKPRIMPMWLIELLGLLGIEVVSRYDFAVGYISGNYFYIPYGKHALILTAGNCRDSDDLNCLNIALEVPYSSPIPNGYRVRVECNYWGYEATEEVIDIGSALVNYGNGYALLKPAYLLKPIDKSAIPGCSGSAVIPG